MFAYPDINPDVFNPKEVYEVKLLLAYFLNQIDMPCTPAQLLEIATGEGIVDYFLYMEAVKEMLDSGTIISEEIDGAVSYRLSEKGKAGAESFKRLVPKSVRDRIYASGLRLFAKLKNEQTIKADITDTEKGCMVSCTVSDSGVTLMNLSLFAPDREQAEHIKRKMVSNPSEFYGRILDYAVCSDNEAEPSE
ncbi:MAG: DUF4364 family protein [Oscillospiraceae bacterium]